MNIANTIKDLETLEEQAAKNEAALADGIKAQKNAAALRDEADALSRQAVDDREKAQQALEVFRVESSKQNDSMGAREANLQATTANFELKTRQVSEKLDNTRAELDSVAATLSKREALLKEREAIVSEKELVLTGAHDCLSKALQSL